MNNPIAEGTFSRLQAALRPTKTSIQDFILNKTKLHGRPFSLKGHEYQGKIIELLTDPDLELVVTKPSQTGISEVIYRIILSWMNFIPGFSAAIVFPTKVMSNEVMSTRINPIISDCEQLKAMRNKDVDSNSVKMFLNDSILYSLGASSNSKSTVINRPIRAIIADELARCDQGVITSMRSRQKHQAHKSSVYFSTPLFEGADIDLQMSKCGVIYEQILKCRHCSHYFFPNFYTDVRLKGFKDPIRTLKQEHVEKFHLDFNESWLECPKCWRPTAYEYEDFEWVDTAEHPKRPKTGLRLSAFCMPSFVTTATLVENWLAYDDKVEFHQQELGLPATKSDTAMDTSKIVFDTADHGVINVWGLDLGKVSHLVIASVSQDRVYAHTRVQIQLRDLRQKVAEYISHFGCIAGVVDLMPYSDIAVDFSNKFPNTWSSIYYDPATPVPELFKYKLKDDDALGKVRQLQINKNLFIDTYVNELMNGRFAFKSDRDDELVRSHHEAMRRVRDPKYVELRYQWIKAQGNKTTDHWFHSSVYAFAASRMMLSSSMSSLPLSMSFSSFRLKSDL